MLYINTNSEQNVLAICPFIFPGPNRLLVIIEQQWPLFTGNWVFGKRTHQSRHREKYPLSEPSWTSQNILTTDISRKAFIQRGGAGMPAACWCWASGLSWRPRLSPVPRKGQSVSRMNSALLKHETSGIWGNRCTGFPQVGTSHGLRICAVLQSLPLVSTLPPVSRAWIYLMTIFFPLQDFLWELLGLFTSWSTQIIPECGQEGYEILCSADSWFLRSLI